MMSETRRQIFRNSILSAFGLMSVPALAACSGKSWFESNEHTITPSPIIVGYLNSKWYIFELDSEKNSYKVFELTDQSKAPNIDPTYVPYDTKGWYSTLSPSDYVPVTSPIPIVKLGLTLKFNGTYLDAGSASNLQEYSIQNTGAWNEIRPK